MKNVSQGLLSAIVSASMIASLTPAAALAADNDTPLPDAPAAETAATAPASNNTEDATPTTAATNIDSEDPSDSQTTANGEGPAEPAATAAAEDADANASVGTLSDDASTPIAGSWAAAVANLTQAPTGYDVDEATNTLTISTPEALAYLAKQVKEGSFNKTESDDDDNNNSDNNKKSTKIKTIKLGANIDLQNKLWTPIGTSDHYLEASFDGCGYTVSNLNIDTSANNSLGATGAGLFGCFTGNFKNVTINNAAIKTTFAGTGVAVGLLYADNGSNYSIENVNVTGKVQIEAWKSTGTILGCNTGSPISIKNCAVNASESSSLSSNSNHIGGIAGYIRTMNLNVEKCTVENMAITGGEFVGGIIGSLCNGATLKNCTVENCAIQATSDYVGALTGSIRSGANDGTNPVIITSFTSADTTVKNSEGTDLNQMFPAQSYPLGYLGAMVGGSSYLDFDAAITAATETESANKTIYLYNNYGEVSITETQAAALANASVKIIPADASLYSIDLKISAENSAYKVIIYDGATQVIPANTAPTSYEASINNTYYSSANTAILEAASGSTIYLNAATSQPRTLKAGESLTVVSQAADATWSGATPGTGTELETITECNATTYKAVVTNSSAFACIIDGDNLTFYATLQDAFDAAGSAGGTAEAPTLVSMVKNATEPATVPKDAYVTLELMGCKLETTDSNAIINKGNLTIRDSAADHGGTISATAAESTSGQGGSRRQQTYSAVINGSGNLTIESGNFIANGDVIKYGGGTGTISGGSFTSTSSYCVNVEMGEVAVTGGTFATLSTKKAHTGLTDEWGSLTISGGIFSTDNVTNDEDNLAEGASIIALDDGTYTVSVQQGGEGSNGGVEGGSGSGQSTQVTNADGVVARVSTDETGAVVADITVPAGVQTSVVEIPAEGASAKTVAIDAETGQVLKFCAASAGALSLAVDGSVKVKLAQVDNAFADIPDSYWGAESIDFAAARGLFTGSSAATFEPDGVLTRQMAMTVLARLDGVDTTTGAQWYDAGVEWAVAQQLSTGVDGEAVATREQLVTMLWRLAGKPQASDGTLSAFPDAANVSEWAKDAMAWATEVGIITGNAGQLDAQESATRAQAATILQRYIEQSLR